MGENVDVWSRVKRELGDDVAGQMDGTSPSGGLERKKKLSSSARVGHRYGCEHCGKMFKYRYCVENHKRVHTGMLLFKCDVAGCPRKFKWRSSLNSHRLTHRAATESSGNKAADLNKTTTSKTRPCEGDTVAMQSISSVKTLVDENLSRTSLSPEDTLPSVKPSSHCRQALWTMRDLTAGEKTIHRTAADNQTASGTDTNLLRSQRVDGNSRFAMLDLQRKYLQASLLPQISSVQGLKRGDRACDTATDDGAREATETLLLFADSANRTASNDEIDNVSKRFMITRGGQLEKKSNALLFPGSPISHAQSGMFGPLRAVPSLIDECLDLGPRCISSDGALPRPHYPTPSHQTQDGKFITNRPVPQSNNNIARILDCDAIRR
eukprot:Plantae.Rhodophyta-Purpureofilum_apyrenoidigerum.ctg22421.p1 GENE.Plantae.Rhodophyta-Purpureofilum_apyrenoidigerum.ctg22421~~Plantae.Rhodophyta-Purpureofilum_apyrenoidigerum.ctg22421.p1  ORF type:complete len:380 (-),score=23.32 Plantae.Rhodophyta-Purpureofilum_apyrenoidigerum.ctg22421:90-1229(-)